ncbi:putative ABC transporter binding protein NosD [Nymphon striatum]|nr:putative ABC transporter binding protein NosD [Nymphon striatum]
MNNRYLYLLLSGLLFISSPLLADAPLDDELTQAMNLKGDVEKGKEVYKLCIGCHSANGWGLKDGTFPQLSGQHRSVIIKQLADIRAGNRDNPFMEPIAREAVMGGPQAISDVAAYIATLPMNPEPGNGKGGDNARAEKLFYRKCAECHGADGGGDAERFFPRIQGQHYEYLLRQINLPPLQLYVEITPSGGVLKPPPGRYAGPVVIKRPITIDGGGKVVVDGGGTGSVLTVEADNSIIRGLHITNSGISHDNVDSGILIKANNTLVEDNNLDQVLFGIHLQKADNNTIQDNIISSLHRDISLRGDGIRMWYSNNNLIKKNTLFRVRDISVNNSANNRFLDNTIRESRIGMELVFSPSNEIANNTVTQNDTGIVVIYSKDVNVHHNLISHMRRLTGAGLSSKESAEVVIANNEIAHCATGLRANSPLDPENSMVAEDNLFTYNVLALYFYGEKGGHIIRNNHFENNFTDALGSASTTIRDNKWSGNYWDTYQGFDLDDDGIGDRPHDVYLYAERIWRDNPRSRYFRGSPAMEMLDFSYRLAPFSQPELQYSDPSPRIKN